jgi:hypothetical protein
MLTQQEWELLRSIKQVLFVQEEDPVTDSDDLSPAERFSNEAFAEAHCRAIKPNQAGDGRIVRKMVPR